MTAIYPIVAALLLIACITNPALASSNTPEPEVSLAIRAFTDICIKTAPSFSGAAKVAAAYEITKITDAGFMKMGFNKDQSLGLQIQDNKECVITTPEQRDQTLTKQFISAINQYTGASGASGSQSTPFKAKLGNDVFIFKHDRQGGEAFVMLRIAR